MREFDLNIEKVLENWSVVHAIREIIANALDEQAMTGTEDINIYKDRSGSWHIRDYGRGISYQHLTQNENAEKQANTHLIGKFGVGLKDALATFDRHGVGVAIDSKYGHISIGHSAKVGFDDITTLHAYIEAPKDGNFIGTDFRLQGCTEEDIRSAEDLFLRFTAIRVLESTELGEVLEKRNGTSEIFINGIKVADEENFLFSYNITAINTSLRKALNRERTNVGRTAYSERIKSILLLCRSKEVLLAFTENLMQMSSGKQADEMKWVDVQTHAARCLSAEKKTVFVTPDEIQKSSGAILEIMKNSGKTPVFVTEAVKQRIADTADMSGNKISTLHSVVAEFNDSFQYEFIPYGSLSSAERQVFDLTERILKYTKSSVPKSQIKISTRLQPDFPIDSFGGVWCPTEKQVVIRRDMLSDPEIYCAVLMHELTHADTGRSDIDREFETALTRWIGKLAWQVLKAGIQLR